MLYIIIIALLIFCIILDTQCRKNQNNSLLLDKLVIGIVVVCVLGLIGSIVYINITEENEKRVYIRQEDIEIYSLDILNGANGRFILGSGTIESKPIYYYYVKDKDGLYEMQHISADTIKIKQDNESKPHIEHYKTKDWETFWLANNRQKYIIIIPENSIQERYNGNIK